MEVSPFTSSGLGFNQNSSINSCWIALCHYLWEHLWMQKMIWTTTNPINERSERLDHGSSVKKWKQTINYLHQKDGMFSQTSQVLFFNCEQPSDTLSWCLVLRASNRSLWSWEFRICMYIFNMPSYSWVTEGVLIGFNGLNALKYIAEFIFLKVVTSREKYEHHRFT